MSSSSSSSDSARGPSTRAVHAGGMEPVPGGPVVRPVVQSATFFGGSGDPAEDLRYSRYGNNPNQEALGAKMAALEGTEASLPVASGMAATALSVLATLPDGGRVVASSQLYGTTVRLLEEELPRRGIRTRFVDPSVPGAWEEAVGPETGLVFLEVPTNPTLRVFSLEEPVRVAREVGAPVAVDATFASPVNLRPAEHGVDLVIHSATKYLGGHSDLIAGVVSGSRERVEGIRTLMKLYGPALDPHAAWLLDRGLRTLAVRVERHNRNALELARWLEGRPGVARVIHPGLPSHPDHERARELLDGFGGMLSFVLEGAGPAADAFCRSLRLALMAPSLGGVETLVSQPRFTSHVHMPAQERTRLGVPDGFVRVSVGIEDPEDLREDFARALEAAEAAAAATAGGGA